MRARTSIAPVLLLLAASAPAFAQTRGAATPGATADTTPPDAATAAIEQGDWAAAAAAYGQQAEATDAVDLWYRTATARAIAGDYTGAALAFERVQALAPEFPDITRLIAASNARAASIEAESQDPAALFGASPVAIEARAAAHARGDVLYANRAAAAMAPLADPAGDAVEQRMLAEAGRAAVLAVDAVAAEPNDLPRYVAAADALRLAGQPAAARYYLTLFAELGGDPGDAAAVREVLDRADANER